MATHRDAVWLQQVWVHDGRQLMEQIWRLLKQLRSVLLDTLLQELRLGARHSVPRLGLSPASRHGSVTSICIIHTSLGHTAVWHYIKLPMHCNGWCEDAMILKEYLVSHRQLLQVEYEATASDDDWQNKSAGLFVPPPLLLTDMRFALDLVLLICWQFINYCKSNKDHSKSPLSMNCHVTWWHHPSITFDIWQVYCSMASRQYHSNISGPIPVPLL